MAVGDTYGSLGTVWKVATGKPATEDQIGYGALTWNTVGGVASLPQRGDSAGDVNEPALADGRVEHFVGALDGGVLEIPIKYIEGDAGQGILETGAGTNTVHSFQEVDSDAVATFYFGRIMSLQRREATPQSFKGYIASIAVNSVAFEGTEES